MSLPLLTSMSMFKESEHPRDKDGEFTDKGDSKSKGPKPRPESISGLRGSDVSKWGEPDFVNVADEKSLRAAVDEVLRFDPSLKTLRIQGAPVESFHLALRATNTSLIAPFSTPSQELFLFPMESRLKHQPSSMNSLT